MSYTPPCTAACAVTLAKILRENPGDVGAVLAVFVYRGRLEGDAPEPMDTGRR